MARRPDLLFGPAAARAARTRAQAATWAWAGKVASRLGSIRPETTLAVYLNPTARH